MSASTAAEKNGNKARAFMDNDFLLTTPTARHLVHTYAKDAPIVDFHCHIPPVDIASVVRPTYTAPLTANVALNARFPIGSGDTMIVGRVGYTHEDGRYNFATSISSPLNEVLKTDARDVVDAQLSIEKLSLGGGQAKVMLWVKNLTNAKDFIRGIDFGALGYGGGYYADPRTFGVTVGMQF